MKPLTDKEKRILALSLFGAAMRGGPPLFEQVEEIVNKLNIQEDFIYYAKDFKEYSDAKELNRKPVYTPEKFPIIMFRIILFIALNALTARFWLYPGHPKESTYLWCLILIISGAIILFTPFRRKKR